MHTWGTRGVVTALVAAAVTCLASGCLRQGDAAADPSRASPDTASSDTASSDTTSSGPSSGPSTSSGSPGTGPVATATWSAFTTTPAEWQAWEPVFTGVHTATDADVAALIARARSVLERSFTATAIGVLGEFEMARSPGHARVAFGVGGDTYLEAHLTPTTVPPPDRATLLHVPLTVCFHEEARCTTITGDEDPGDRPHLFDTMTDSLVYQASASMTGQGMAPGLLENIRGQGSTVGVATVDSPIGQLDCAVLVESATALPPLEGAPLEPDKSDADHTAMCLDARGLVVLSPGGSFLPVTAYTSMRPGVPAGFATLPFPVHPYS